jgi:hypothetical protein
VQESVRDLEEARAEIGNKALCTSALRLLSLLGHMPSTKGKLRPSKWEAFLG